MKLEFSQQIFETYSSIEFHENPFSGSLIVPCRQTDRFDGADSLFRNFASGSKTSIKEISVCDCVTKTKSAAKCRHEQLINKT
jgi:hypothetical protein